jgi:hypothetical protein
LFLLVFRDSLRHEAVAVIDDFLVKPQLFVLPLEGLF